MKNNAVVVNSVLPKINSIDNSCYLDRKLSQGHPAINCFWMIIAKHAKLRRLNQTRCCLSVTSRSKFC